MSPEEEGGRKLTVGCPMEVASYPASGLTYIDAATPLKVSGPVKNILLFLKNVSGRFQRACQGLLQRRWRRRCAAEGFFSLLLELFCLLRVGTCGVKF